MNESSFSTIKVEREFKKKLLFNFTIKIVLKKILFDKKKNIKLLA